MIRWAMCAYDNANFVYCNRFPGTNGIHYAYLHDKAFVSDELYTDILKGTFQGVFDIRF